MTPRAHDIRQTARHLLVEEGVLPTNRLVRERLGGGSPNLISDTLRLFWQELGMELREASTHPGIPEAVLSAAHTLWKNAVSVAEDAYSTVRTQLETQASESRNALAQAQAALAKMTELAQSVEAERDRLQEALDDALQRASRHEASVADLTNQLTEARSQAAHQTELTQLHAAHAAELKQTLDDHIAAAHDREACLQAELDRAVSEYHVREQRYTADLAARDAAHHLAIEAHTVAQRTLEAQLADRQHQIDQLRDTLTNVQAELETEHQHVHRLRQAQTDAQQRIDDLARELSASQAHLVAAEKTLAEQTAAAEARFTALLARVDALSATPPQRQD